MSCETLFSLWSHKRRHNPLSRPKRKMYLNLIRSMTMLYCNPHQILTRNLIFSITRKEELTFCMLAQSLRRQQLAILWSNNAKALASSLFLFLNDHYLVVIRYYQSVSRKQRVLKKRLGYKSLRLKSQACVCDCHLLSLPWEKVMRLSSFVAVSAQRVFFLLLRYIPVIFSHTIHAVTQMLFFKSKYI